jgi:hypothetical protein
MKTKVCWTLAILATVCSLSFEVSATHLRAAQIRIEHISGLTYKITVTAFLNSLSNTKFGGFSIDDGAITFGDGTVQIIPEIIATPQPNLGQNISIASYTITHTYAQHGVYKVNYRERDRSAGILNIPNAGDVAYSTYATVNTNKPNHFPKLNIPPVDKACTGQIFFHNAGASDEDGDLLTYEMSIPQKDANNPVDNYLRPDAPTFYTNSNYNTGNEDGTGPPSLKIDGTSGQITWDAPGNLGQYNIAFKIKEWRLNNTTGVLELLSESTRDMQIIVEDCENLRPILSVPSSMCVEAGTPIDFQITGMDPEGRDVKLEAISEIFDYPVDNIPATYLPAPFDFKPTPASLNVHWNTDCIHAREQPYQIVFKATDKPPHDTPLVTFASMSIKVLAPAPTWLSVEPDLVNHYAVLKWNSYTCQNAESIQVWRRVGSFSYNPTNCDAGLPEFYGYELVDSLNSSDVEYIDTNKGKGLAIAARYCYRLIAFFKQPAGGSSYVSAEMCMDPILTDAPVVTHVSVEKTDLNNGAIRVSWRNPFNISSTQFPRPYKYEIYRADSLNSDVTLTKVGLVTNDTTFLNEGINTDKLAHHYQIVLYAIPKNTTEFIPIDTSAIASSVWLEVTPGSKKIELNWSASTPWTNVVQKLPHHLIFRGPIGGDEKNMTLIDSVDVSKNGFTYTDAPLKDDDAYSYKIETRGTYGNPQIKIQLNFSQRVSSYPINNLLPCKPVVTVDPADCEAFYSQGTCDNYNLTNTIHWSPSLKTGCRIDIVTYRLYAADSESDEFKLIATDLTDTTFSDTNLPAFARCYRIEAIDGLGQISEMSDASCNDNCPYYELPNIFTPNDDGCNDRLSAFNPNEDPTGNICTSQSVSRCPSFAEQVKFTVYSRWGKKLYSYTSGNGKSIYIDWDGRDDKGNALESAIYYYTAEVNYTALNPSKKTQLLKGWVQLIR